MGDNMSMKEIRNAVHMEGFKMKCYIIENKRGEALDELIPSYIEFKNTSHEDYNPQVFFGKKQAEQFIKQHNLKGMTRYSHNCAKPSTKPPSEELNQLKEDGCEDCQLCKEKKKEIIKFYLEKGGLK